MNRRLMPAERGQLARNFLWRAPAADGWKDSEFVALGNLTIALCVLLIHRQQKRAAETLQRWILGKQFRARTLGVDRRFKLDLDLLLSDGVAGSAKEKHADCNDFRWHRLQFKWHRLRSKWHRLKSVI